MADEFYTPDVIIQEGLFNAVDNIKPGRTSEGLLFQVMLDWGVDLASSITKKIIQDKDVCRWRRIAACFDALGGIDEAFVKELVINKPLGAVFRDAGFKDYAVEINIEQLFKLLAPATAVKCI